MSNELIDRFLTFAADELKRPVPDPRSWRVRSWLWLARRWGCDSFVDLEMLSLARDQRELMLKVNATTANMIDGEIAARGQP